MADFSTEQITPAGMHLRKTEALDITWADGHRSSLPVQYLRKHCPCAGCKGEKDLLGRQLMPILKSAYDGPITAVSAELVGNYAIRIAWADGHDTGIYTFRYLRQLDAEQAAQ